LQEVRQPENGFAGIPPFRPGGPDERIENSPRPVKKWGLGAVLMVFPHILCYSNRNYSNPNDPILGVFL